MTVVGSWEGVMSRVANKKVEDFDIVAMRVNVSGSK